MIMLFHIQHIPKVTNNKLANFYMHQKLAIVTFQDRNKAHIFQFKDMSKWYIYDK